MLRVYNATARYVNQAGRRKGSIAVYLEPWHADILDFLEIRLNQGDEEARCRDLFSAMWIPDLFMKRVEEGGNWSLFCPDKAMGLSDVYGKSLKNSMKDMREEVWRLKLSPPQTFGRLSLSLKAKLVHHTCCTRMRAMKNQPKEPRYDQILQPVLRNSGTHGQG